MKTEIIRLADVINTILQSLVLVLIPNFCTKYRDKNSKLKLGLLIANFWLIITLTTYLVILLPVLAGRVGSDHAGGDQFRQPGPDFLFLRRVQGEAHGRQDSRISVVQAEVVRLDHQSPEKALGVRAHLRQRFAGSD